MSKWNKTRELKQKTQKIFDNIPEDRKQAVINHAEKLLEFEGKDSFSQEIVDENKSLSSEEKLFLAEVIDNIFEERNK
jgi:hypothetical protein